jgi:hypothetical protein
MLDVATVLAAAWPATLQTQVHPNRSLGAESAPRSLLSNRAVVLAFSVVVV